MAVLLGFAAVVTAATDGVSAGEMADAAGQVHRPLGVGSGADIGARLFADRLSRRWGQPVIVDNRPGGDGLVAIAAFVNAHDDHVLLFGPSLVHLASVPARQSALSAERSGADRARLEYHRGRRGADRAPHRHDGQLVARARAEPGKLNWAGVTGTNDFMFAGWLRSNIST